MSTISVRCPPGCGPGSAIQVQGPNGQMLQMIVPAGVGPGQVFQARIGPPPPAPGNIPNVRYAPQQPRPAYAPQYPQQQQMRPAQYPPVRPQQYPPARPQQYPPPARPQQYAQPAQQQYAVPASQPQQFVQLPGQAQPRPSYAQQYPAPKSAPVRVRAISKPQNVQPQYAPPAVQQQYPQPASQPRPQQYAQPTAKPVMPQYAQPTAVTATQQYAQPASAPAVQQYVQPQVQQQYAPAPAQVQCTSTAQPPILVTGVAPGSGLVGPAPAELRVVVPDALIKPIPQVPVNVSVSNYLSPDNERIYTFVVDVAGHGETWRFSGRFSEISKMERHFKGKDKPQFANYHLFADYKKNMANVEKRNAELQEWFSKLLNTDGHSLVSEPFLESFEVPQSAIEKFHVVAKARIAEEKRKADVEKLKIAEIERHQKQDCDWASTFITTLPLDQRVPILTYPKAMHFCLKNKLFSYGDAVITGPGDLPYFKMVRQNRTAQSNAKKNCQFIVQDMSERPLMVLQEHFVLHSFQYMIHRYNALGQPLHLATVTLNFRFGSLDQYIINNPNTPMQCAGEWMGKFTINAQGSGPIARIERDLVAGLNRDTYHVRVNAGQDVIMLIGIACCIDRIHHEAEAHRKRRR